MLITLRLLLDRAMPYFAPLPKPVMQHLFVQYSKQQFGLAITVDDPLERAHVERFAVDVRTSATAMYTYMDAFIRSGDYSTEWLASTISMHSPEKRPVPRQTTSYWRTRGLLRDIKYGYPTYESASWLLVARMVDKHHIKRWMPDVVAEDEALWWCWRQDDPASAHVPAPLPLTWEVPASALLWTPWIGASWLPGWTKLDGEMGAARFAGPVTLEDLALWDRGITQATTEGISHPASREWLLNDIASVLIRRFGYQRLHKMHSRTLAGLDRR